MTSSGFGGIPATRTTSWCSSATWSSRRAVPTLRRALGELQYRRQEFVGVHGLADVHLKSLAQRVLCIAGVRQRGQRGGGNFPALIRGEGANSRDQLISIFAGHGDITQDDAWFLSRQRLKRLSRRPHRGHVGAAGAQSGGD